MADIVLIIVCCIVMLVVFIVLVGCWIDCLSAKRWVRATDQAYEREYGPSVWMHDTPPDGDARPDRLPPRR